MMCQFCKKDILVPSQYKIHIRTHSQEKPFNCGQCGKQFAQKSNLTRHISTHLTQQYKCDECNKKFSTRHNLQRHQNRHLSIVTYQCSYCDKDLKTEQTLKKHMATRHTNRLARGGGRSDERDQGAPCMCGLDLGACICAELPLDSVFEFTRQ